MANPEREIPKYIRGNKIVREGLEFLTRKGSIQELSGLENIEEAREILRQNYRLFIMANHLSHLDVPTISSSFANAGFSDIIDQMIILMGTRISRNPFTNAFSSSYPRIYIPQAHDEQKDGRLTPTQHQKAIRMMRDASKSLPKAIEDGKVILVFPEGTRSRSTQLSQGMARVAHYLKDDYFVLPVGLWGTETAMPVGGLPNLRKRVQINVGEPFCFGSLRSSSEISQDKKQGEQQMVDRIMGQKIAPLLPGNYRGFYQQ